MAKYLFKPTNHYVGTSPYNPSRAYDTDTYGDTSTYCYYSSSSGTTSIVPYGCNNATVLNLVNAGVKIKSLVCHVKARKHGILTPGTKTISGRCVYDITGSDVGSWKDAGGDSLAVFTESLTDTITEYTISFPTAIDFFNTNPSEFAGMGCRFWGSYWRLYDLWYEIELEDTVVTYDTIFSFKKWKNSGIVSANQATISNITDTGFTITAQANDAFTNDSPFIHVTPGNTYTIEYDSSGSGNEVFVFYHTANNVGWNSFKNSTEKKFNFTVPSGNPYITIRCDSNIQGNSVSYSNFRIYPASESYMSASVSASERSDTGSWSMPTPTKKGYKFLGWYTGLNGTGTKYTSSSVFPSSDLVLYSAWEVEKYYLDLNGFIDGVSSGGISPAGTADVYINGSLVSNDIGDYYAQHNYGSTYEIKDIRANTGYEYAGVKSGSLSGTITAATSVVLEFISEPLSDFTITEAFMLKNDNEVISSSSPIITGQGFILKVKAETI